MTLHELCAVLTKPRHFHVPHVADFVHRGEHLFHMGYMGLVSIESHYKWYGKVAALCVICMVLAQFMHEAEE